MANTRPHLGIIAALPAEARAAGARDAPVGEMVRIAESVLLIRCGVGRARAARAARDLIDAGAGALLSWGTAAALSRELHHGDVVLPHQVLSREGRRFSTDTQWRDRLCATLESYGRCCYAGTVAEADSVLENVDDKLLLHALSGALIADMESAAVAEVCERVELPLLVVRAVSDRVAMRIPACALAAVDPSGDVKLAPCLGKLLLAPGDLLALLRLARSFRAACAALAGAVHQAGPALLLPPPGANGPHA